jgi:type II secretory pathway pseudopilin PulG
MNKAFTLVELLVYIGLFSILLLVLTQIFVATINTQLSSQSSSGVSQDNRYILARLMYDIHRADAVNIPAAIGTSTNNLSLKIGANNYIYTLSGNNFTLTANSSTDQLNGLDTDISNLQFTRLGNASTPSLIKVNYTIKSQVKTNSGIEIKNIDTVIGLRPN